MIRALAAFGVTFCLVSFAPAEVVRIDDRVEVSSAELSLGDIAQIVPANSQLAGISIGYAPYPGHYRWISKPDIENYLHRSGLDGRVEVEMDERVLVTRQSQLVDPEMIEEEVTRFLSTIHPRYSIAVENLQVPSDLFVPAGPIEISIDPPASISRLDGLSLRLEFRSEGQRVTSQWVRVNAVAQGDVVVIKKDVPYGRPLQESDVLLEAREFDRLESYFATEGEVIGCVTKRALFEGEILTSKDLKQPVLVNRGDVVTLLARGPSFVVSALGKSRDSGSQGDAVVIENLDSKQLVHATVVGKKTVEVVVAGGVR